MSQNPDVFLIPTLENCTLLRDPTSMNWVLRKLVQAPDGNTAIMLFGLPTELTQNLDKFYLDVNGITRQFLEFLHPKNATHEGPETKQ